MLNNDISLNNILVSFESTLKIEYAAESTVRETLDDAKARLENVYQVTLDKSVFDIINESQLSADNVSLLMRDVKQCLADLSLFMNLKLYHKDFDMFLADVNYLGYDKGKLMNVLKYCQDKKLFKQHRENIISPLNNTLNNISMCTIKRLFIILLMFNELGIDEGVSIIAQLLYLGGLVS